MLRMFYEKEKKELNMMKKLNLPEVNIIDKQTEIIAKQKDKIKRRNKQIKDLKKKIKILISGNYSTDFEISQ